MPLKLSLLYRGPLSSCNYDCAYCPFAKREESFAQLAGDRRALARFVAWVEGRGDDELSVFFTPWGEALVRSWYPKAIARLSHLPQIRRAAIQTNLSCRLDWLADCDQAKIGLWCSFHPSQTTLEEFLAQCRRLDEHRIRYSVGVVGLRENFAAAERLRSALPSHVYMWINAFKDQNGYYTSEDMTRVERIDPLFRFNAHDHPSRGRSCRAGASVVSVDGDGQVYRCHFIREPIGNLYDPQFERSLRERPCTNGTCGCHIGYVHLDDLGLYEVFGDGVLERIPLPQALSGR